MAIPVLSGVGQGLNWYQHNVTDPISGSIMLGLNQARMGLGLGDQGSQQMASMYGTGMPGQSDPSGALNMAFNTPGSENPIGRFAFESATDPLNLLGTGIVPEAAHGLAALTHADSLPMVAHGLDALGVADKLPGMAMDKGMEIGGNLLGRPALGAAGAIQPYVQGFADAHPDLSNAWSTGNRMWRAGVHMMPGFPIRNLLSDTTRNLAFGDPQSSIDTFKQLPGALAAGFRGETPDLTGTATGDFMDTFGGNLDDSITDVNVPHGGSVFRRLQSSRPAFNPDGSPTTVPDIQNPKDWLVDKLSGWNEFMNRLDTNQDMVTRAPVWGNAAKSQIGMNANAMADTLDRAGYSSTAGLLADRQGMLAPDDLAQSLTDEGASPTAVNNAVDSWTRAVDDARQAGTQSVYKQQFDYSHRPEQVLSTAQNDLKATLGRDPTDTELQGYLGSSPADLGVLRGQALLGNLATNSFGSYKFVTQDLPTMLRLSASHPALANVPAEWDRQTDIYNYTHGLPASMHGDMLLGDIGGNKVFANPLELTDFPMLVDAMTNPAIGDRNAEPGDASPLGQFVQGTGEIGFGLNPLIRAGLQATGQMGHSQVGNVIKPLNLLNGIAGLAMNRPVDVEGPIKGAVADVQSALGQGNTYPYQEYLVRKREADLAGGADPWTATQTDTPRYQQAQSDTAHTQALRDILGAVGLPEPEVVYPEQSDIGRMKALSQAYAGMGMSSLAGSNPTGQAYSLVDPMMEAVRRFETLPIDERITLLRDPQFQQLISQKLHGINPTALTTAGGY